MRFKRGLIVGITFAVVGFMVSIQYNMSIKFMNKNTSLTQMQQELISELKNLREIKNISNEELNDINRSLEEYEIDKINKNSEIKELKDNTTKYKLLVGYIEGNGPGIIITIENQPIYDIFNPKEDISVHDNDSLVNLIMTIINVLNISGAEAISINNQRYVSHTEIYHKYNSIYINSVPVALPLTIKAIGNDEVLEKALNIEYGVIWEARKYYDFHINLQKSTNITIPRYNRNIQYKYAKPVDG